VIVSCAVCNDGSESVATDGAVEHGATHASGLAGRYALALYDLAGEQRALDAVVEQMDALGRLIDESADLRRLLASPLLDIKQARDAMFAVLDAQGFGGLVRNFVGVVALNRRLAVLRGCIAAFAALVAQKRGVVVAHVASAQPLNDLQQSQLLARLIEAGYGNVTLRAEVDASLLGGLVVRIGARLYDSSLKSRLQRLQYAMKGAI
jgi:F-type H+-transporting ATPase subunit delta